MDVDQNGRTAAQYQITGVPALYFFKGGKVMNHVAGALPREEIDRMLRGLT